MIKQQIQKRNKGDTWFKAITFSFAASIPLLLLALVVVLINKSWLGFSAFGWGFVFSSVWDPLNDHYGALPFIFGTLMSAFIALLIAVPLGLGCAIYLSEISQSKFKEYVAVMVELLAAIPSVVYGLWGIFVLGPWVAKVVQPLLKNTLGFLPIFQGSYSGSSLLTAGIILAIMILPTITVISREVFQVVPHSLRESALALGATRWETFKLAVFGPATSGIIGAVILGLGRALGETMAVTMVIGNRPKIAASLFAPAYTLASVIANEFAEATSWLNLSVLVELALILLVITIFVNGLARLLIWKTTGKLIN
ncbi:phosphate ABC transporter permease subunit PstC [candidate division WOR-1 bacterium RIFOXYB2_FULL_42_35]|uniref:Phosphate transport system permease protein n=1 Tax=candidate division WOR-1 bacterium RIFOXYC2_FULL_41_25 TaxID=1802586 RepID=A0A1F4TMM7_UNCSA|nr:MAG: phosphate ABC transporter permease subunit PstC [candidate division WOR-1 bacterium RIFOXYA2_FULL_41_14]OGC23895.1 MAG: phosphate ABC transporter permease subunit PstC [candidate division WOR-1 bacterium RIFOXYB2_FULL_42_35]OGC33770.1 MAG: phosphate ABC transporter permease subunit PstC [candidate division WOR-1 bacterium RIFOXYC2_FULL_41_25]OGC44193.1 MAG: phosphate ABC transporter permease subunit PstC [candidate division WOR-1 bacterium RIFOXYD2_FULL_41_8]